MNTYINQWSINTYMTDCQTHAQNARNLHNNVCIYWSTCTRIVKFCPKLFTRVLAHDWKGMSSSSCTTTTSQKLVERPHTVSQNASPSLIEILSVPLCNTCSFHIECLCVIELWLDKNEVSFREDLNLQYYSWADLILFPCKPGEYLWNLIFLCKTFKSCSKTCI